MDDRGSDGGWSIWGCMREKGDIESDQGRHYQAQRERDFLHASSCMVCADGELTTSVTCSIASKVLANSCNLRILRPATCCSITNLRSYNLRIRDVRRKGPAFIILSLLSKSFSAVSMSSLHWNHFRIWSPRARTHASIVFSRSFASASLYERPKRPIPSPTLMFHVCQTLAWRCLSG